LILNEGYRVTVNTNQVPGYINLDYMSSCGCVYSQSTFWAPPEPPPPPPPCCEEVIQAYPIPASNTLHVKHAAGTPVEILVDGMSFGVSAGNGEVINLDISRLAAGPHILHVKSANGKFKAIRFVKTLDQR
jgi:hypothetical protein